MTVYWVTRTSGFVTLGPVSAAFSSFTMLKRFRRVRLIVLLLLLFVLCIRVIPGLPSPSVRMVTSLPKRRNLHKACENV